jgi:hypothetical protein
MCINILINQAWCHMTVISGLEKLRQKDQEFKARRGYIVRP